jgi:hypothetical protein
LCLLFILTCAHVLAAESTALDDAVRRLYNFDFQATHGILDKIIAAEPQAPLPYGFRAAAYLFSELDRLGTLETEFLTGDDWAYDKKKLTPDPKVRVAMQQALRDAESRAQVALKANGADKNALFTMTIVQGVTADYMALVEKKQFGSMAPSKKSNNYAQQLLRIDPKFYDAYLTTGFSEYVLGSLPFFIRWFVHWENVSGSKEKGRQNLELTAREGRYFKSFARILLAICAMREKRPKDAQKIMADLSREYPENALFKRELGKLNTKYGVAAN